jgi:hypothetical protein
MRDFVCNFLDLGCAYSPTSALSCSRSNTEADLAQPPDLSLIMFTLRPNKNVLLRHISRPALRCDLKKVYPLGNTHQAIALVSTQAEPTSTWTLKPYYVTTPIFYPNAGEQLLLLPHAPLSQQPHLWRRSAHWSFIFYGPGRYLSQVLPSPTSAPTGRLQHRNG